MIVYFARSPSTIENGLYVIDNVSRVGIGMDKNTLAQFYFGRTHLTVFLLFIVYWINQLPRLTTYLLLPQLSILPHVLLLLVGSPIISNHHVARSIMVRHLKPKSVSYLVLIVHGSIKSTHIDLQDTASNLLAGKKAIFALPLLIHLRRFTLLSMFTYTRL